MNISMAQYCMVVVLYENRSDYKSHIQGFDLEQTATVVDGVSTTWFLDVRRTSDNKLARLLVLNTKAEKDRVLAAYPATPSDDSLTAPSIVAEPFPAQDIRKSLSLYLPNFTWGAMFPNYHKICGYIISEKAKKDEDLMLKADMVKKLVEAYQEAMGGSESPDMLMDQYTTLQMWTANIRQHRERYRPELSKHPLHRTGSGADMDLGITDEGMIVDLLSDDWRL